MAVIEFIIECIVRICIEIIFEGILCVIYNQLKKWFQFLRTHLRSGWFKIMKS